MFFSGKTATKIIEIFKYQESDIAHKKNLISIQQPMTHWNTAHKLEVKTKGYQASGSLVMKIIVLWNPWPKANLHFGLFQVVKALFQSLSLPWQKNHFLIQSFQDRDQIRRVHFVTTSGFYLIAFWGWQCMPLNMFPYLGILLLDFAPYCKTYLSRDTLQRLISINWVQSSFPFKS